MLAFEHPTGRRLAVDRLGAFLGDTRVSAESNLLAWDGRAIDHDRCVAAPG